MSRVKFSFRLLPGSLLYKRHDKDVNFIPFHDRSMTGREIGDNYQINREQRNVRPVNQQLNRSANNQTKVSAPQRQMNIEQQEDEEISTMEYLEEKARQDAAEHARDKWEENMRLHQNYGGLRVAERLFDGDTVPGGKKCSVCEYCGAENLIPMIPRERYSCYFCREPLR